MVVVVSALLLAFRCPGAGTDPGDLLLWNAAARILRRGPRPGLRSDQAHGSSGVDPLASHAPATAESLATGRWGITAVLPAVASHRASADRFCGRGSNCLFDTVRQGTLGLALVTSVNPKAWKAKWTRAKADSVADERRCR